MGFEWPSSQKPAEKEVSPVSEPMALENLNQARKKGLPPEEANRFQRGAVRTGVERRIAAEDVARTLKGKLMLDVAGVVDHFIDNKETADRIKGSLEQKFEKLIEEELNKGKK